jgi:predicted 3-demethylubiquinone-9 3-methyltransferase (glyoxalase superfamily)
MFNLRNTYLFTLFVVVMVCVIIIINLNIWQNSLPVYCLMITGYSDKRKPFALRSIANFKEQYYNNKHLIIINQSKDKLLNHNYDKILEVYLDKKNKTLGNIRNISLQFVPPNAVWTTWDDDDWRHPMYLSTMMKEMYKTNLDFLMFSNRIEYNLNNKFTYKSTMRSGYMHFFSKYNEDLQYEDVSTSEDVKVKQYAINNLKYQVLDNDPRLYIRFVHDDNTSVYVQNNKQELKDTSRNNIYFENKLNKKERSFVDNIISKYYK